MFRLAQGAGMSNIKAWKGEKENVGGISGKFCRQGRAAQGAGGCCHPGAGGTAWCVLTGVSRRTGLLGECWCGMRLRSRGLLEGDRRGSALAGCVLDIQGRCL